MRIGIISDIHGNIKALDSVLEKLKNENISKIICLGDLIGGAPMSEEVIQRIISMGKNVISVRGNRENYIIDGMPKVVHDEKMIVSDEQIKRNEWIRNELSKSSIEFINMLKKEMFFEVENNKMYIVHYPMNQDGSFRKHIKRAKPEENEIMFSGINSKIYLYGHTHAEIYNLKNDKIYINPGSLGCPGKTNKAPYGILDINKESLNLKIFNLISFW